MNTFKDYFKRARPLLSVSVIIVTLSGMLSCGTGPDSNQEEPIETPEHAEIALSFSNGGDSLKASGPGVESTWDSELGIVSITMNKSLDGTLDLYGSLNLGITPDSTDPDVMHINNTILSTSACLICDPGEPINGKFYSQTELVIAYCYNTFSSSEAIITDSFINVKNVCFAMVDNETGEKVAVKGSFTAIDESSRYFNQ